MNFKNCLFSSSDLSGCGWIRSYLPAKHLDANFVGGFNRTADFSHIKNIIFQRQSHSDFIDIINNAHAHGIKTWYDLDDDLWAIYEKNPAKSAYTPEILSRIELLLSMCDGVFTSTIPLRDKLLQYNPVVNVVPNLVEIPTQHKEQHSKIRIGYAGSASHVGDFSDKLIYTLKKLYNKYSDKIEYVFFGYAPPELVPYVTYVQGIEPQHYIDAMNYMNFDISLIPLRDSEFNKSKSNLKWLDSGICRSCPVASDVYCYSEIQDGYNGIKIVDDRWYDVLETLIHDNATRNTIAMNAYTYISKNYSWMNAKHKQIDVYKEIL